MCKVIGWVLVGFGEGTCKVSVPRMVQLRDENTRKSGVLPEQVAQSRGDKKRLEKRESRQEEALSDGQKAGTQDRRAPPDFEVTKVLQEWAAQKFPSVDIDKETPKFLRHEFPMSRNDWDAAWKTWIQWNAEFQQRKSGTSDQPNASEELLKLGKDLGVERQSGESESDYLDRITEINQRRIDGLNH